MRSSVQRGLPARDRGLVKAPLYQALSLSLFRHPAPRKICVFGRVCVVKRRSFISPDVELARDVRYACCWQHICSLVSLVVGVLGGQVFIDC